MIANLNRKISLAFLCISLIGCSSQPAPETPPPDAEIIFWEQQSWEVGGGRNRLTIWQDGRSEIIVVPGPYYNSVELRPRKGWSRKKGATGYYFVRTNVFPEKIAAYKFNRALADGIHLLATFKPDYIDGEGTLVGVQVNGRLTETIIPMFLDRQQGTPNHERYVAVAKVLATFDKNAFYHQKEGKSLLLNPQ